ncbi:MAG: hypothetical protein WCD18_20915, partial [Thermosynechococcaceae cyanobacterium]
ASDPNIRLFAQISAAQNFSMHHLRDALFVRLKHEGNQVFIERAPGSVTMKLLLQESREAIKVADAHAILNAGDLSSTQVSALEQKETTSPEEQRAITKYYLKEFYGLETLTLQDILLDREGRTRGELLNLEAQLYEGLALDRTTNALERQASWRQGLCPWDISGTELRREIRDRLGLTEFIRQAAAGREWTKVELGAIADVIRRFAPTVKTHLNFTINEEMSDVQVVHQLLSQMGIKIEFRWTVNHPDHLGTKIRVYSLNQGHWQTLKAILDRRAIRRASHDPESAGSPTGLIVEPQKGDLETLSTSIDETTPEITTNEPHLPPQTLSEGYGPLFNPPDLLAS